MEKEINSKDWLVIDFGESTHKAFLATEDSCDLIRIQNQKENPSIISFSNERRRFGHLASSITESYWKDTVYAIKSKIGSREILYEWNYEKIPNELKPMQFESLDLLSYYLDFFRNNATDTIYNNLLYIIPGYFKQKQIDCVKKAAELAEIPNFETIDSHFAVAYSYLVKVLSGNPTNSYHMFIDASETFLDIFICKLSKGKIEEKYSAAIDFGGLDLTIILANQFLSTLEKSNDSVVREIAQKIKNGTDKRLQKLFFRSCKQTKESIMITKAKIPFQGSNITTDADINFPCSYYDLEIANDIDGYVNCLQDFLQEVVDYITDNDLEIYDCQVIGGNSLASKTQEILEYIEIDQKRYLPVFQAACEGAAYYKTAVMTSQQVPEFVPCNNRIIKFIDRDEIMRNADSSYSFVYKRPPSNHGDQYTGFSKNAKEKFMFCKKNDQEKDEVSRLKNLMETYIYSAEKSISKINGIDKNKLIPIIREQKADLQKDSFLQTNDLRTLENKFKSVSDATHTAVQQYIKENLAPGIYSPDKFSQAVLLDFAVKPFIDGPVDKWGLKQIGKKRTEYYNALHKQNFMTKSKSRFGANQNQPKKYSFF